MADVLVTGGAGFIGSHIVDLLLSEGLEVVVVDNLSTGSRSHLPDDIPFYKMDVTSPKLTSVFKKEKPRYVIHEAAQIDVRKSVENPVFDAQVNIVGSINVLQACVAAQVEKVVYASSAALYGDPAYLPVDEDHPVLATSGYGVSKHTVEHYVHVFWGLHGLEFTVLRYANVYGARQDPLGEGGVVAIFCDRMGRGEEVTIYGDGEQTRDFVYVGDVARANLMALTAGNGQILNVSCESETSVNSLFELIKSITGTQKEARYVPERPGEIRRSVLANGRIEEALQWQPQVSLEAGLRQTLAAG